jgi:hypothetical protein
VPSFDDFYLYLWHLEFKDLLQDFRSNF